MSDIVCEIPGCDETDGSVVETTAVVERSDFLDNNDRNEKLGPNCVCATVMPSFHT
jgi:hypothetical protein